MVTHIDPVVRTRAQKLRTEATPPERKLWSELKLLRKSHGLHFRRQVPTGPNVIDFACHSHCLVVELDGDSHLTGQQQAADTRRDEFMSAQGYRTLRFSNADAMGDAKGLVETILKEAACR
jgi:very-short-patch-repair endonuclease